MKDKKLLIQEYQELESNILQFKKLQKKSELAEDKEFWQIEIECTQKEMKSISLEFCNKEIKAA